MFIAYATNRFLSPVGATYFSWTINPPAQPNATCRPYGAWDDLAYPASINMSLLRSSARADGTAFSIHPPPSIFHPRPFAPFSIPAPQLRRSHMFIAPPANQSQSPVGAACFCASSSPPSHYPNGIPTLSPGLRLVVPERCVSRRPLSQRDYVIQPRVGYSKRLQSEQRNCCSLLPWENAPADSQPCKGCGRLRHESNRTPQPRWG